MFWIMEKRRISLSNTPKRDAILTFLSNGVVFLMESRCRIRSVCLMDRDISGGGRSRGEGRREGTEAES
jgi:ribosomal protein L19E